MLQGDKCEAIDYIENKFSFWYACPLLFFMFVITVNFVINNGSYLD